MTVKAILTDIEGTTSSIDFVHKVLFPYASRELPDFVRTNQNDFEIAGILQEVRSTAGDADADIEQTIGILLGWIKEDRKITALKSLQGHIWKHGYENGGFTGHMYDDAVENLQKWRGLGIDLYVYSSGSVGAQKLLFGHSDAGDLRPLFKGYFDTRSGNKRETTSYNNIAGSIGFPAGDILFLSDVAEELDAAAATGMQTMQLVRDEKVVPGAHRLAQDFDEVTASL
jgi:enolase-phosphatase E1